MNENQLSRWLFDAKKTGKSTGKLKGTLHRCCRLKPRVKRSETMTSLGEIVKTEDYPIDLDPESQEFKNFVNVCQTFYHQFGILVLPGFLRPEVIPTVIKDVEAKMDKLEVFELQETVFQNSGDERFPDHHVRNRLLKTKVSLQRHLFFRGFQNLKTTQHFLEFH